MSLSKAPIRELDPEFGAYIGKAVEVILTGHFYSVPVTPSSVPAWDTIEYSVTVKGLKTTDIVIVNRPAYQDEIPIVGSRVSASNTLSITYLNMTGLAETPTSETLSVIALRKEKE